MTLCPKNPPVRDRKWLDEVRNMRCVICGSSPCDPAHIRHGLGGGMGMKPGDDLVVPLCHDHHREQHQVGERAFWRRHFTYNEDLVMVSIKALAQKLYRDNRP